MSQPFQRQSDRWMTPGVAVALIFAAAVVTLGIFAGVVYLSAIGIDTGPTVTLAGSIIGAVFGPAALIVQLVNRAATSRTERNTGKLPDALAERTEDAVYNAVAAALPHPAARDTSYMPGPVYPLPPAGART